jgi:hypothetical protein
MELRPYQKEIVTQGLQVLHSHRFLYLDSVELLSISFTSVILYSFQKVKYTPTGNHAHVER